ncbi:MAG: radical SAM family heme chaperone HemW [Muribaculaceae bacterium]|nr:radical SAM family heme chaperone HemW [Muribaculaceae bacterium]
MSGLYIHIPYCHSKCHYCDFYSGSGLGYQNIYVEAIAKEFSIRRQEIIEPFKTIYIGGGTPSSLEPINIERLLYFCKTMNDVNPEEFTVEVNPEDVTSGLIETLRSYGVNRVSMGIQSLVDSELKDVGRNHLSSQAIESAGMISESFPNFSYDLIFGLPGQTLNSLRFSLDRLLELRPPHISVYLLSYEPGTRLYARLAAGKINETDESTVNEMYSLICRKLADEGYNHYEISNFALTGYESRHNSSYWASVPYLGLGASAHSFDGRLRRYNPSNLKEYLKSINAGKSAAIIDEEDADNRLNDILITRLRTARGLHRDDLLPSDYSRVEPTINSLIERGQLSKIGDSVRIPEEQWLVSDNILRELIV